MTRLLPALILFAAVGCEQAKPTKPVPTPATPADHEHGPGKHGGTVFDLGNHHAEFCVDHARKEVTVYVLSGNLQRTVAVAADKLTVTLKSPARSVDLKPAPLDTDPPGKASRFVGTDPAFGVEQEFAGTVAGVVDGVPVSEPFAEVKHDHGHE